MANSVGYHEAEAGRIDLQPPDHEVHLVGQPQAVAAHLDEIARGEQRFQMAGEGGALFARRLAWGEAAPQRLGRRLGELPVCFRR